MRNDEQRFPTTQYLTGDTVVFEIELECPQQSTADFRVGLHLYRNHDLIFAFNAQERGFIPEFVPGLNRLRLVVPCMPLLEGRYSVHLVGYMKGKGIIENIPEACFLDVAPVDMYGAGFAFRAGHGVVLINHTWECA